ncbi:MAG: nitroreductase family deazaflavin-dependent oxidoreductase [Acidimicrobiales bacterium]
MNWQQSLADVGFRVANLSHRAVLRLSGGRVLRTGFGMPLVELHTVGRTTGKERRTMLASPVHDEGRVVLVASKGGDDRHPQWYANLVAHPDVEITMDGVTRAMRARTASPEERGALWPQIVKAYQGYDRYQERTDRTIPVVICEPRPS